MSNNIILTGLPRSGTTLTCHLLNKLPDCVALHEPLNPLLLKEKNDKLYVTEEIATFFAQERHRILYEGCATSKSTKGGVPDNPMAGIDPSTGKRVRVLDGNSIRVSKKLESNFSLIVKQPSFFTAVLDQLTSQYFCYAIIRNPLSVLLSWNSVEMPVSNGRAPAAEIFDDRLTLLLNAEKDKYHRQIKLLNWFFQKYLDVLPLDSIIYYEDIIKTQGKVLSKISSSANNLSEVLQSKNANPVYSLELKGYLAEQLKLSKNTEAIWSCYNRDKIT